MAMVGGRVRRRLPDRLSFCSDVRQPISSGTNPNRLFAQSNSFKQYL